MTRQIILDTETTGLSPENGHRLIEVGCLEMINRRITSNRFHQYVNPKRAIDEGAVKVHGITEAFLKDKPTFNQIAEELFSFLMGAELIIHNAPFDLGFLNAEFARVNQSQVPITKYCSVIDTLVMARKEYPGQPNTLDALCRRLGVNNKHRDLHGALIDAALLAEVYLRMTGGQTQLFASEFSEEKSSSAAVVVERMVRNTHASPILYADAEELFAHTSLLDKMEKKGKCIWRQIDHPIPNPSPEPEPEPDPFPDGTEPNPNDFPSEPTPENIPEPVDIPPEDAMTTPNTLYKSEKPAKIA